MKASLNELRSLLKQAFEGCGLDHGAYENAADLVLWSQASGLASFELLERAIQQCLQRPTSHVSVQESGAQSYRIDVAGDSILLCGVMLSDLVSSRALESEFCVCHVSNACDPILLAKPLKDAQRQGLCGMAYWFSDEQAHVINSSPQESINYLVYPEGQAEGQAKASEKGNLTLVYARDQRRMAQYQNEHWQFKDAPNICHSAENVRHHRQDALSEGLEISSHLWLVLNQVAENVLVESTEQSRMGAGA